MSGFSKRPHRSHSAPKAEKKYDMPVEEEVESYTEPDFFDDDDDDDIPDTRRKSNSKRSVIYDEDDEKTEKKPNIFIRFLRAAFPVKGDGVAESVRKIVFDAAVIAFIITGGTVLNQILGEAHQQVVVDAEVEGLYRTELVIDSKKLTPQELAVELNGKIDLSEDEIISIAEEKPGIMPVFIDLYSKNSDIVGWVNLGSETDPIVNISYPVMQSEDNDYYLTHNFFKEEAERGAIFADYRNTFEDGRLSANTILYGHNMWNGDTMFAKLSRYYQPNMITDPEPYKKDWLLFYKEHPTITFNTLYENAEWKVFACVLFNTQPELGEVYPYLSAVNFSNEDEFNGFILDIMDRSVLWTDVDLTYGDELLTLSTCHYPYEKRNADTRCAVFARKVRPGESAEVDVSKAQRNPDPLKFAYQQQRDGTGAWGGRKWDTSKLLSYNG